MLVRLTMLLAVVVAILAVRLDGAEPGYTMRDLGAIPDNSQRITVTGINGHGDIVGYRDTSQGTRAFSYTSDHGLRTLVAPGCDHSYAYGINDFGQVAGFARLPSAGYHNRAYVWDASGTATDICPEMADAYAYGINNQGQVPCAANPWVSATRYPYIWTKTGGMRQISTYPGTAFAISANGQVAGGYEPSTVQERAFRWDPVNGLQDLGDFPGGSTWSRGNSINNDGWVIGFGVITSVTTPALWTPGSDIQYVGPLPPGSVGGWGYAINNHGTALVGAGGVLYRWTPADGLVSLATLFPELPVGWRLLSLPVINDAGQIAGTAGVDQASAHLVVFTPVPEPGGLVLAMASGAFLALPRRRRRSIR